MIQSLTDFFFFLIAGSTSSNSMETTTEEQTTTKLITTTTEKPCNWFHNGNGFCEDENNHASCNYDGGMLVQQF
jgi:hypothetical protein